ncbi:MAG: RimK-like ATPgrasp N-terminal domain-containing protein [Bacillota bacterium]
MDNLLFQLGSVHLPVYNGFSKDDTLLFNMHGDYTYLTEGYYRSLDAQMTEKTILPTVEQILDAYVVPLAMEKAKMHNLPVPEYKIVNDHVGVATPAIAYPINPFSDKFELIVNPEEVIPKIKTVTRLSKYAAIVQTLPDDDYRIDTLRCILGKTLAREYEDFAWQIFTTFGIPLMKVKVIVTKSSYLFSSIGPFELNQLTINEKRMIEGMGTWQK